MTFKPNSLRTVMLMAVAPVIGLAFQSCGDDTDDYPTVDGKAPTLSLKTIIFRLNLDVLLTLKER